MSAQDSASVYFQSTALGATAVGQVVALYDTILRDLRRALEAIDAEQVEKRINAANHALMVIGELQGVLDFERGGEAAKNLNAFYNVTRAMILRASMNSSREQFQEILSMCARLRSAWSRVESTVAPTTPTERLRVSSNAQSNFSQNAAEPSDAVRTPSNGRWRA
jgi:flagellar protein FliS